VAVSANLCKIMLTINFMKKFRISLGLLIVLSSASAHVGEHPSVHDTVAGIADRMKESFEKEEELKNLTAYQIEKLLTDEERHVLGSEHITFRVNVPVTVSILRDRSLKSQPFWVRERGFTMTGLDFKIGTTEVDVWEKDFDAGDIGLGVNSFTGGKHYLVLLKPQNEGDSINVTNIYPGKLRIDEFKKDTQPYVDNDDKLGDVPKELEGLMLLRTEAESADDARLVNFFRWTDYPATKSPDQLLLTWTGDPKTSQTIQWRTSTEVKKGLVKYQDKALMNRFTPGGELQSIEASTRELKSPTVLNDPLVHMHAAHLTGLMPATTYVYSVGDGDNGWSELSEFTTAPEEGRPFAFMYMGDAQNGLDRWGTLINNAFRERPDASFYIMAGDLVDRGNERDDWDSYFFNARNVFKQRTMVPAIGNHENQGGHPTMYLDLMQVPKNGPEKVEKKRAYWYRYSNALFIVLDTNIEPEGQKKWLEETLEANKDVTWKFAVYHHPAYSSAPNRDNTAIRQHWVPLFDKYHVDLALQGHDHAYLRTFPMKGGKKVSSTKDGTVYIVSVSGTKMYSQDKRDYTEFGMTNTPTYQVLDIQISGNRLVYRSYDIEGNLKDNLIIEK
jgi:hypothetical protein